MHDSDIVNHTPRALRRLGPTDLAVAEANQAVADVSAQVADLESKRLIEDALDEKAPVATQYRDLVPVPAEQPANTAPAQAARGAGASRLVLSFGASALMVGGGIDLALSGLHDIDPVNLALACAAPFALTAAVTKGVQRVCQEFRQSHTENHYHGPTQITEYNETHNLTHNHARWLGRIISNNKRPNREQDHRSR